MKRAWAQLASAAGRPWRVLSAWLAIVIAIASPHSLAAQAITDDSGHVTEFSAAPRRIVSLLPSLTETVCALDACSRLVAVDRYSDWPPSVRQLPQVGGGLSPNVEAIVALEPDLVLAAASTPAAARLRALGLNVLVLEPRTIGDVHRVVDILGRVLQVPGARALQEDIDSGVAAAAASIPARLRGERVYFEVSSAPYAAGRASFIGELLHALGLDNVIGPEQGPFPKINPEFVVRAAPELVIVSAVDAATLAQRPGWGRLRALREDHVCAFSATERDLLVRSGPRLGAAARWLADCVVRAGVPHEP